MSCTIHIYFIYLSIYVSFCGYRDAPTMQNIDEKTLTNIEILVLTDMHKIIRQHNNDGGSINGIDFFGEKHEPDEFAFSSEERTQILRVSSFFTEAMSGAKLVVYPDFGQFFTNDVLTSDELSKVIRGSLYANALDAYKAVGIDNKVLERVTEETISFSCNSNRIIGFWKCILCAEKLSEKKNRKKIRHDKNEEQQSGERTITKSTNTQKTENRKNQISHKQIHTGRVTIKRMLAANRQNGSISGRSRSNLKKRKRRRKNEKQKKKRIRKKC